MVIFREEIDSFLALRVRDAVHHTVNLLFLLSVAFFSWRQLVYVTHCPEAMVVVISGSMEPGYYRGDILFLHRQFELHPIKVGDVVVYNVQNHSIPIVHRIVKMSVRGRDGKRLYLTKGDNNLDDDRFLYPYQAQWIEEEQIVGKSFAYLPRLGYITLMMSEFVVLKFVSLLTIAFFFFASDDN